MPTSNLDPEKLKILIKQWSTELGFQQMGVSDIDLSQAEARLQQWLSRGFQGDMSYMAHHGKKRSQPELLVPGTVSVLTFRMDYLPNNDDPWEVLNNSERAYISRYALGRDYHKVMRNRLKQLAQQISQHIGDFGFRVFVDSAPVLERPLAVKSGLGWMGKQGNIINKQAGTWFFLGELYTDLPLNLDTEASDHCGHCTACIDICPTNAIVEPYVVDARLCISYLTIEYDGSIPVPLRPLMGNRIYGCDDCLIACPWNRFAKPTPEPDFAPRNGLDSATLISLFQWDQATFLRRLEGSPIRRIGHIRWLRNIAIALGNAARSESIITELKQKLSHDSEIVVEHVKWAIEAQFKK